MIVTLTPNPVLDRTLIVPTIAFDEVLRAASTRVDWGGKGFNVSRALKALDVESVAMALAGGSAGQMLEAGLNGLGIATDFVPIEGETRTNVVISEAGSSRYVKVNEAGPIVQPAEAEALLGRVRERADAGQVWVLAGSLPPGLPPDFYATLIELLHEAGARVALDASGDPLRLGCAARPFLVKPNAAEAAEVSGVLVRDAADALQAARYFLDQGVSLAALSLGAEGLLLAQRGTALWARPPATQVGNPTGAGDALLAGIIYALNQGLALPDVARWGVACGTAAAGREGVAVGTPAEVAALFDRVHIDQFVA